MGRACESWLRIDNEDHEKFARAMMRCENASGECCYQGRCIFGNCFRHRDGAELRNLRKCAGALGCRLVREKER